METFKDMYAKELIRAGHTFSAILDAGQKANVLPAIFGETGATQLLAVNEELKALPPVSETRLKTILKKFEAFLSVQGFIALHPGDIMEQ
jgi:hypothetical protein